MDDKQKKDTIKEYFESLIDEKLEIKGKNELNILVLLSHKGNSDLKYLIPVIKSKLAANYKINFSIVTNDLKISEEYLSEKDLFNQIDYVHELNNKNKLKFDIVFSLFFLHTLINWELAINTLIKHMNINCKFLIAKFQNETIQDFYSNFKLNDSNLFKTYIKCRVKEFGGAYFKSLTQSNLQKFLIKTPYIFKLVKKTLFKLDSFNIKNWKLDDYDNMNSYYISPFYGLKVNIYDNNISLNSSSETIFNLLNTMKSDIEKKLENPDIFIYELDYFYQKDLYQEENVVNNFSTNYTRVRNYIDKFNIEINQFDDLSENKVDDRKKCLLIQNLLYNQVFTKHLKFLSFVFLSEHIENQNHEIKEITSKKEVINLYPIKEIKEIYTKHINYFKELSTNKVLSLREAFINFNNKMKTDYSLIITYHTDFSNKNKILFEIKTKNSLEFLVFKFYKDFNSSNNLVDGKVNVPIINDNNNNNPDPFEIKDALLLKNFYIVKSEIDFSYNENKIDNKTNNLTNKLEIDFSLYENKIEDDTKSQINILKSSLLYSKKLLDEINTSNSDNMAIIYITNKISLNNKIEDDYTNAGFLFCENNVEIDKIDDWKVIYLRYQTMKDSLNYFSLKEILPILVNKMAASKSEKNRLEFEKNRLIEESEHLQGLRNFRPDFSIASEKLKEYMSAIESLESQIIPKGKGIFSSNQMLGILFDYNVSPKIALVERSKGIMYLEKVDSYFKRCKNNIYFDTLHYLSFDLPTKEIEINKNLPPKKIEINKNWLNFLKIIYKISEKFHYWYFIFLIKNIDITYFISSTSPSNITYSLLNQNQKNFLGSNYLTDSIITNTQIKLLGNPNKINFDEFKTKDYSNEIDYFFILLKYIVHRTYHPKYYKISGGKKYSIIYVAQLIGLLIDVKLSGLTELKNILYLNEEITINYFNHLNFLISKNLLSNDDLKDEYPQNSAILQNGKPIDFLNYLYLLLKEELIPNKVGITENCFANSVLISIENTNLKITISCSGLFPIESITNSKFSKSGLNSCINKICQSLSITEVQIIDENISSNSPFQIKNNKLLPPNETVETCVQTSEIFIYLSLIPNKKL